MLNAYAIVFAALLVPAGRAADLIGRRAAFLTGMIVFAVASAACAAAPDVWVLVGARVVQAAGGALLMPASLSLLLAAAPPERRTGAIRAWTSVGGAAAALGPVVGGALVEASWHWVFLVNVPVVAIALIAGVRVLPLDRSTANAAEVQVGEPARTSSAPRSSPWRSARSPSPWSRPTTGAGRRRRSSAGSRLAAVLIALFIYRSARHPAPVIELHLLRRPLFATATAANVVFGIAFGAMLLLVTLWCQDVWGWSALRTGLGVAPGPLLVPFWAIAAGPIARRIGPGPVAALGCAIYACGCVFWRLNLSLAPDYPAHMLPGMLLTGTGVGLTLPTLVSAAVSAVPPNRFATGSGIVTMARQVGIVLGVAILVTVLGSHASGHGALPGLPASHRGAGRRRGHRGPGFPAARLGGRSRTGPAGRRRRRRRERGIARSRVTTGPSRRGCPVRGRRSGRCAAAQAGRADQPERAGQARDHHLGRHRGVRRDRARAVRPARLGQADDQRRARTVP